MHVHFIKTPEKRDIIEQLNGQFGVTDLPYLLIESGKEKIRAFSGSLSKDEIAKLSEIAHIELIGMYLIKKESDMRLSLDATNVLQKQITKNIIDLSDAEYELWVRGTDLDMKKPRGTYVMKYKSDFVGCGRSNELCLFNYMPKDRRLKNTIKKPVVPNSI
ncbi:MAG: hypothetical protein WCK29_01005 [archaeon]